MLVRFIGVVLWAAVWTAPAAALQFSEAAEGLFGEGVAQYRQGEYAEARQTFERLGRMAPHQHSSAARLLLAKSQFRLGEYDPVLLGLRAFDAAFPGSRYAADAALLRGDALYLLRRYFEAATEYARLLEGAPEPVKGQAAERLAAVAANGSISAEAVERLAGIAGKGVLRQALLFGEARWYARLGWEDAAVRQAERYLERHPQGGHAAAAERLAGRDGREGATAAAPDSTGERRPRLGLLLPLSGEQRQVGHDLLNGVQLANEEAGRPFELVSRDLGAEFGELPIQQSAAGGLIRTARATRSLVEEERVEAIISPLFSADAVAAAVVAEAAGVPLIIPLAQQSGIDLVGDFVFQLAPIPDVQGRALGEYATMVLGLETLAVLAPLTDLGAAFEGEFARAVDENGGRIVHSVWYVPNEKKDFKEEFAELRRVGFELEPAPAAVDTLAQLDSLAWAALDTSSANEIERLRVFKAVLDGPDPELAVEDLADSSEIFIESIDGVLIVVENFDDARTIAPQLHFNRLKTQILGNEVWNDPEAIRQLLPAQRKDIGGGIFVAPRPPQEDALEYFTAAFRGRFGRFPGFAAHGYDAARLVLSAWRDGHRDPDSLRQWLAGVRAYAGASGAIGFAEGRRTNGELALMKIDGRGRVRPVTAADLPDFGGTPAGTPPAEGP